MFYKRVPTRIVSSIPERVNEALLGIIMKPTPELNVCIESYINTR